MVMMTVTEKTTCNVQLRSDGREGGFQNLQNLQWIRKLLLAAILDFFFGGHTYNTTKAALVKYYEIVSNYYLI